MKISNETKVGVLAAFAITLLILGFNFLKGRNLFEKKDTIYAVFQKVESLSTSDPVKINGLQVGIVSDIEEKDQNLSGIIVSIHITKTVNIPDNSYAVISSNPLGSTTVNIVKGTSTAFLNDGDTVQTNPSLGLLDEIKGTLSPTVGQVNGTLKSVDSLVEQLGSTLDPKTRSNLQAVIANLSSASASLNTLLNTQQGALAATLNNMSAVTGNLRNNNDSINRIIGNVETMTRKFSELDLQKTLSKLESAVDNLNLTLKKVNSNDGTLGLLMNDPKLYNNLNSTTNSLNLLMQDIRLHPKRYVNVSVFGKKDKSGPLMQPMSDTATKAPGK
ncbi:MAG: MlaD family protein [Chitinophagaceae bacterium]|jgi:phospholipid/cholesterol/gamma-HCH transport system substrate-binding protein|nr:MlaD family protein [Chitinophagaceae bacterium]